MIKLSVVIPAYNETNNLKRGVLDEVDEFMKRQPYPYEVLIVDDGSTDGTVELVKRQIGDKRGFRLAENKHGGKAVTVMTGMLASKGEVAVFTDMDQATPIAEIENILPKFDEGFDVVVGSRHGRKGAPIIRKVMAWGFALLRGIVLGLPFSDTQCGFKAFNRRAIETVFPELLQRWQNMKVSKAAVNAGFDVETLFLARKKGLKIAEVPVNWRHVGSERVQAIGDSVEALSDILRIRIDSILGRYV